MPVTRLNFQQWRELALESPERVVSQFVTSLDTLTSDTRKALFASFQDELMLQQSLKASCAEEEAPLSGVPYVLQDLFDVEGLPTTCGAPFNEPFEAPLENSSLLYQKLNTLGAYFFAKTVPSEFGVDRQGRNPTYGDCPHADGTQFVSGGGAGASIRAVTDGIVPLGFGLDTSGGIRIPAAFHGLFGFRMASNNYARDGVFPIALSIESVGWVTANILDLLSTFEAFHETPDIQSDKAPRGYLLEDASVMTSPAVKSGLLHLTRDLDINDDPWVNTRLSNAFKGAGRAFEILEGRELYSIHRYWVEEYRDRYDPALIQRIERGMDCSPSSADESDLVQERIRSSLAEFFLNHDYLIMPICPEPNPEKEQWRPDLEADIMQLIAPASLAFLPTLILPISCAQNRHSAAQVLINPRKLHIVPDLIAQIVGYYGGLNA